MEVFQWEPNPMGRPSVIGQLQSYASPKDKTRRAALARSSPKPGGFWQREDLTSKRQARPSMAGESRVGRSVGHEFERGRPSVNVSAADASYAVPNSRSAPRGGNSITISTSWDVSSFGVRRRPACPAILGCRIRLFLSPLALLRQLQVTSLQ